MSKNRCNRAGNKVIFQTEMDAKLALSRRMWRDKGEVDYYPCPVGHFHLTSERRNRGNDVPPPAVR